MVNIEKTLSEELQEFFLQCAKAQLFSVGTAQTYSEGYFDGAVSIMKYMGFIDADQIDQIVKEATRVFLEGDKK